MSSSIQSVCLYCGSSDAVAVVYKEAAQVMGRLLAEGGKTVVYGGGQIGLMGLVADSALKSGGNVIGFTTRHLDSYEVGHRGITQLHVEDDMHARKLNMFQASDAFVVLPGGYGTLDEFFETLTWKQIGLHNKPIIILNVEGYWDSLKDLTQKVIAHKFASPSVLDLVTFVSTPQEVMNVLNQLEGKD